VAVPLAGCPAGSTKLILAGYRQYTTNVLVIEAHALFLSRVGIAAGQEFLMQMLRGSTGVVRVRAADEERAREIVFRYADKDFSLADAISVVVMERLQIRQAFNFDQHFTQYGFPIVAPGRV
jgi:predicted nucleic acid-binding protein